MNETFEVAERQHGLLTRAQLSKLGLSDAQIQRRVSAGVLARALPNVFRVVGSVPTTAQGQLAACLWAGRSAVLSHASAGMLMRLEGITTNEVHVTVPTHERRRGHGIVVHGSVVPRHDVRIVDSIPCTSAARTLIDCAISLDDEMLEAAVESARRMGLVTWATLQRAVVRRPGAAALRRVLAAAEHQAAESRLEVKLTRLLRSSRRCRFPSTASGRIASTGPGQNVASRSRRTAFSITAADWLGNVIACASPRSRRWVGVWCM